MSDFQDEAIVEAVMEAKLERERMLREEEGSEYSVSVPGSTINSVRRLDRQDSRGVSRPINIPGARTTFLLPNSWASDR